MKIISAQRSQSAAELRQRLQDLPGTLSWGVPTPGVLGGTLALDGFAQLQRLREAGVRAPEATASLGEAQEWARQWSHGSVWGRRLRHSQGRDIAPMGTRRWRESDFWVQVIPGSLAEWRIHIFKGRSIARGLKVWTRSTPPPVTPVRARRLGWHMIHTEDPPKDVREAARAAVKAVGYDFAGVDVLVDAQGLPWVLEANRSVGLDAYTAEAYEQAIRRYVAKATRSPQ